MARTTHGAIGWTPLAMAVVAGMVALAFRVWLGRGNGYPTDMAAFIRWADAGSQQPLGDIYERLVPNYPPASLTMFWLLGKIRSAWPVLARPDLQYLSMKAPFFLADLATALLVYLLAAHGAGKRRAGWAAILYLFNPAVISDSAIWGQTDGMVALFPLLALLALDRGAWWIVGPCLAAALATKFQAVTLGVTLLSFVVADVGVLRALATLVAGGAAFTVISLPFLLSGQFGHMVDRAYLSNLNIFPSLRLGALNFWDLLDPAIAEDDWALVTVLGVPITPKVLGLTLFVLAWLPTMLAGCARRDTLGRAYALGLVAWEFFMFPTRIHERYLLPAVAFFTVTAARGAPMAIGAAVAVTTIHLYSSFFRYSWSADTMVPMMGVLMAPVFLGAFRHLRAETIDQPDSSPPRPTHVARWTAALGASAAQHIGISTAGVLAAGLCVGLAVHGYFHRLVGGVPIARLDPAMPSAFDPRLASSDADPFAIALQSGQTARVRFPPTFGTLHTAVSAPTDAGAAFSSCAATFRARSRSILLWESSPVTAATPVQWIDVAVAPSDTELTLSVQAIDCDPHATFRWLDPRLVPFRTTSAWRPDGVFYLSDMEVASPWFDALVRGTEMRRDRSVQGNTITVGGRQYGKGLGVRADSVVEFAVPPGAAALHADIGFDDEVAAQRAGATLAFTVLVDGREGDQIRDVSPGGPVHRVQVPVAGAARVMLMVASPSATSWDHADWADARFVR